MKNSLEIRINSSNHCKFVMWGKGFEIKKDRCMFSAGSESAKWSRTDPRVLHADDGRLVDKAKLMLVISFSPSRDNSDN